MKVDILLGLQWGDEGKGKVVDVLTPRYGLLVFKAARTPAIHWSLKVRNMCSVLFLLEFSRAIR